ncbi:hypothetical protein PT974_05758 [Cladobotryum mycophilum]|uniref:Pentatricopeptide repeat domain-containing protein n=1 Tax=Cladobotryum mycophilum TaxID=491253 RepID=A0ABR0SJM6_9HYPO
MSQGIKSIWSIRSRCIGTPVFSAAPGCAWRTGILPSTTTRRFQSTAGTTTESSSPSSSPSSPTPELPPPSVPTPTDIQLGTRLLTQLVGPNYARNQFFRDAYKGNRPNLGKELEKKLASPYVPTVRDYPSRMASNESRRHARSTARLHVAFDIIWKHFETKVESWTETFGLMKRMTTKRSEMSKMAAVRIVLPKSWDLDVGNRKVEFVDSATGLVAMLRVSADHQNPSAIILRGNSSVLAKAADELVVACPEVEVYKLGEVAAFGYEVKRLWPAIEDAPDSGSSIPEDKLDNIWVHKEHQPHWIDWPYEKTPIPEEWTMESFEGYITALVFGRLRPHLAGRFYRQDVDTDGVRIDLMLKAFTDPAARASITPGILKMAMAFMAHKGGHRAAADKLLKLAEEWGMPMDTDVFNVMLEGYVAKRDVAFFHKFLLKMQSRYFHPNVRTWLLFLELVQREIERRQIIVAMYDLGFFEDPATRRGIARIMASHDAYVAFKAGKKLDIFMAEQRNRYGVDWFTTGSLNCILAEFFPFHDVKHRRFSHFKKLIERQSEDGRKIDISTINLILQNCIPFSDWNTALWALSRLAEYECEPDAQTYDLIISLAIESNSPGALGVAFFYATLNRMLRMSARAKMSDIFTKRTKNPFWKVHKPKVFAVRMGKYLQYVQRVRKDHIVAGVEHAILRECEGYRPLKSLSYCLDVALRTMDGPFHQQLNDPRRANEDIQVGDLAIKLRGENPDGEPVKKTIHLDGSFVPETMIKRRPRGDRIAFDAARERSMGVEEEEEQLATGAGSESNALSTSTNDRHSHDFKAL